MNVCSGSWAGSQEGLREHPAEGECRCEASAQFRLDAFLQCCVCCSMCEWGCVPAEARGGGGVEGDSAPVT